jgi:hypothetical protein
MTRFTTSQNACSFAVPISRTFCVFETWKYLRQHDFFPQGGGRYLYEK